MFNKRKVALEYEEMSFGEEVQVATKAIKAS
jgi:hypothetical protein